MRVLRGYYKLLPRELIDFVTFFALQGSNFLVVVVNMRAIAHLQYEWAVATDALFCFMQWTLMRRIASAKGIWCKMGYITGGTVGSLAGIWITRTWG